MNAAQSKQIVAVAKQALALLNPEWEVSRSLREQLELAMVETVPVAKPARKSGKIKKNQPYKPFTAEDKLIEHVAPEAKMEPESEGSERTRWTGVYLTEDNGCLCIGCKIRRGFNERGMAPIKMMRPERILETPESIKNRLSHCACGGTADDHAKDELENLLKCSHCDDCEAFHYETADSWIADHPEIAHANDQQMEAA